MAPVQGAHQSFDVGLELGDLFGVGRPEFLEPADPLAQTALAVWGTQPRHVGPRGDYAVITSLRLAPRQLGLTNVSMVKMI
ncbi:hypothetical protein QFZ63_000373 [Streptomyces sp. B3I7]|uniref:hypothetical protein n=1 Tax=Streptomyces sp. B3I7 TaxID=3042269 RepID=UPI002783CB76|nr:hypothetical protein [Streptomyces sp. B3I7]MDQ0808659.1 hypothetical protein [Streptomyces sp. B3I7]